MRLIDADAANVDYIPCYYGSNCHVEDVEEWLKDQPTVDAVPVDKIHFTDLYLDGSEAIAVFKFGDHGITLRKKCEEFAPVVHGRWVHLGGDEWCCSACGNVIHTEGSWEKPDENYCSNCGAKMDGGNRC